MKSIIDNLEAVLMHIAGIYTKLLEEAEAKRASIIDGDVKMLEDVLEREYELLDAVQKAEKIRVVLTQQAEEKYNVAQDLRPVKLTKLVAIIGDEATGIDMAQTVLKDAIEKFRYRNRQNEELLKASLEHVNAFLDLIKGRAGAQKTYDRKGKGMKGGMSLLDRRA